MKTRPVNQIVNNLVAEGMMFMVGKITIAELERIKKQVIREINRRTKK